MVMAQQGKSVGIDLRVRTTIASKGRLPKTTLVGQTRALDMIQSFSGTICGQFTSEYEDAESHLKDDHYVQVSALFMSKPFTTVSR